MIIEKDRYKPDYYSQKWLTADKSSETVLVEDIEVENYDPKYECIAEPFWQHISDIDNRVQQFCDDAYRASDFGPENYIADLAWIIFYENGVTLGYWGRTVNFEIEAECSFCNGSWTINEIRFT